MNISHNWLQTYFEKKIPDPQKMAKLFPLNSFEIEGLEEIKDTNGNVIDTVIDAKILPDRAHYALSHKGIAEEISFMTKLQIRDRFANELQATITDKPVIKIENSAFCRRYIARCVELGFGMTNITPEWLKASLETIGQRSISPIVDATNYIMYDIGQPLHAFDADKIKGNIVIRAAKDGEKIVLLDGRELTLTSADNVIADDEGPLVVAGAKGGMRAEISKTTKRIMIESANFDPIAVRRTSTKYDIRSDSSKRFENEITQELAIHGMNNISAIINEMIPGSKFGPIVDEYPNKAKQTVIDFDPAYLEERLGIKIPYDEAKEILKRMNIGVIEIDVSSDHEIPHDLASATIWTLTIPYERLDLNIREDIVEEVGRIYGYDQIKGILPPKTDKLVEILPIYYLSEKIKNILISNGFSEVSLYTLVENGDVETVKPLAKDKAFARKNLIDSMTACVERNALNADLLGLEAIKIFEIGHIFSDKNGESVSLSIGVAQIKKIKGFKSENIITDAIKKLASELEIDSESISKILTSIKPVSKGNCSACEINLSELVKTYKASDTYKDLDFKPASTNRYKKFSLYPYIVRDIAVFVPETISNDFSIGASESHGADIVWKSIEKGINDTKSIDLLARHSLFDVFKKDGKVSYAFRMIFQSIERTLTDDEVNGIMAKINAVMKDNNWEVR